MCRCLMPQILKPWRYRRSTISSRPPRPSASAEPQYFPQGPDSMSTEILMPALSPTMTEGKLSKWLKHPGDNVKSGDVIAEIETDKATMEVEAVDEGVVEALLVPEGTEEVKVNTPIARLKGDGEASPSPLRGGVGGGGLEPG